MLVRIYPENPNQKEIDKVVKVLQDGGLVVYPTDTVYAIGCDALNVRAVEKICQMKGVNPQKSNLSIICYDLSNLSEYAKVSNDEETSTRSFHLYLTHQQRASKDLQEPERSRNPCTGQ